MFFFTKNKKRLRDLIPSGMVDIHSHLMFGIDDGAKSEEETLYLVKAMLNIGFDQFITTPHTLKNIWDNTTDSILSKEAEIKKLLIENNIKNSFKAASEYFLDAHLMSSLEETPLLTLKNQYVLVEMSYMNPPIQLYDILFAVQLAGYTPILAHPERYSFFHSNLDHYQKLKKAGCLFQLNLLSTTGYYGSKVASVAHQLLKSSMIDFVGSDVHHEKHIEAFDHSITFKDYAPLEESIKRNALFSFS